MKPLVLLLALASTAPAALADVLVVGGGGFATPQAAVDAASDGDVILVQGPSAHAGFTIDGKGLSVLADGGTVDLTGPIVVRNTVPQQTVLVWGFHARGFSDPPPTPWNPQDGVGLLVEFSSGPVRVVDCTFEGADSEADSIPGGCPEVIVGNPAGSHAIICGRAQDVAFLRCTAIGGPGAGLPSGTECTYHSGSTGAGLYAIGSHVGVADCIFVGGLGGWAEVQGQNGGAGAYIQSGTLVSAGSAYTGGEGGAAAACQFTFGGIGGPALRGGPSSSIWLLADGLLGGEGGTALCDPPSPDGPPLDVTGALVQFSGAAYPLTLPSPVREGEVVDASLAGEPGELALLFISLDTTDFLFPSFSGSLFAQPPWTVELLVLVPGGGTLDLPFVAPQLPGGLEALQVWFQALVSTGGGGLTLSGWSPLVLVDDAF